MCFKVTPLAIFRSHDLVYTYCKNMCNLSFVYVNIHNNHPYTVCLYCC